MSAPPSGLERIDRVARFLERARYECTVCLSVTVFKVATLPLRHYVYRYSPNRLFDMEARSQLISDILILFP
jgi:hypothetical protein